MGEPNIPSGIGDTARTKKCFRCDGDVKVAMWDCNSLAETLLSMCSDCSEEVPEFNLWDVSQIEEEKDKGPNLRVKTEHPVEEHEEFAVVDKYRERGEKVSEQSDGDVPDSVTGPDEVCPEIYIRDVENQEALEKARQEVREMVEGTD